MRSRKGAGIDLPRGNARDYQNHWLPPAIEMHAGRSQNNLRHEIKLKRGASSQKFTGCACFEKT